jgi:nuclear GTP-binding protein
MQPAHRFAQDWIRGKIPFYVPPPALVATDASTSSAVAPPSTLRQRNAEGDDVGRIKGVVQPLHQIVRNTDFLSDDEGAGDDDLDDGINAVDYDEDEEWGGIIDEDSLEVEVEGAEVGEEPPLAWDDIMGSSVPAPPQDEADEDDEDDLSDAEVAAALTAAADASEEDERPVKAARMTTNKRKVHENFYTTANVKNKNRNKQKPDSGASGSTRGRGGRGRGRGRGGRR